MYMMIGWDGMGGIERGGMGWDRLGWDENRSNE